MTPLREFRLHLLKHPASTNSSLLNHLCRRGSVFTAGTLGPDEVGKDAIEKQIAGKWHFITLQEASDYVEHEILHERFHVTHFAGCAVLFNKDTFYPDISSNRSAFTTRDDVCKIILSKENMDGCYKAFCHVLLFVVLQPVVRKSSPCHRYTSTTSLTGKEVLPRKSSRPFVLL